MPSPFPGMDPYLEGYLWPDVHHRLASEISRQLTPLLKPRYVARLEIYVLEDSAPEAEIGIMYPDVEVLTTIQSDSFTLPVTDRQGALAAGSAPAMTAPLRIPVLSSVQVRLVTIEIRDAAQNKLVTCIEILSPVNKRAPGLEVYRKKRQRLYQAGVHLLEIDLIRRGTRPLIHPRLPDVAYLVTLTRSQARIIEAWPIKLQDQLPIVPLPLLAPDPAVPLDLSSALSAVYDEAAYELSVDYGQSPPPPSLSAEDADWVEALL